jgi:hypothetical protein
MGEEGGMCRTKGLSPEDLRLDDLDKRAFIMDRTGSVSHVSEMGVS